MKKIILSAALCAAVFGAGAAELAFSSKSHEATSTQEIANETIYYDGPAYAMGDTSGMFPKAGSSVSVYWTNNGCTVNGNAASTPGQVSGGYPLVVNGKVKYMNYYVMYGGERYFFQR